MLVALTRQLCRRGMYAIKALLLRRRAPVEVGDAAEAEAARSRLWVLPLRLKPGPLHIFLQCKLQAQGCR